MTGLFILLAIIAVVVIWFIAAYNKFITMRNRKDEAWSDIDVQLKRRYDLIPNLVNTVKGYAKHESGTFEKVTEARAKAISAGSVEEHAQAENMLTGALKSLFAVSENYPDLKANENFMELQRELTDTENKIQAARRFFNTNVRDLNIAVESFPSNIVANIFKFTKREFFELDEDEAEVAKDPVKVDF
jgi:LemA protein